MSHLLDRFADRLVAALLEIGASDVDRTSRIGGGGSRTEIRVLYDDPKALPFAVRMSLDGFGRMDLLAWKDGFPEGTGSGRRQVILEHAVDLEDFGRANRMSIAIRAVSSALAQARIEMAGPPADREHAEAGPKDLAFWTIGWMLSDALDTSIATIAGHDPDDARAEAAGLLAVLRHMEDAGYEDAAMPGIRAKADVLRPYAETSTSVPSV